MQLFKDIVGKGTYATYANAVKRIEKVNADFGIDFRYIIAASADGRFFPVAIPNRDQQHYTGALAHNGICVTF